MATFHFACALEVLPPKAERALNRGMAAGHHFLVADCDRAVMKYLAKAGYSKVTIYVADESPFEAPSTRYRQWGWHAINVPMAITYRDRLGRERLYGYAGGAAQGRVTIHEDGYATFAPIVHKDEKPSRKRAKAAV